MHLRHFGRALFLSVSLLFTSAACAEAVQVDAGKQWTLDGDASSLSFVSVKATQVGEAHKFGSLSGGVSLKTLDDGSAGGEVNIAVDLTSVNTNIAIRDERMREHLFETAKYPLANVRGHLPVADFLALPSGSSTRSTLKLMLDLHGAEVPFAADVLVSRLSDSRLVVASTTPVVLSVASFDLVAGVEKLRELAGLPSIAGAVPVSFVLTLNNTQVAE